MCKETNYIIWRDEDKDHCQIRLINENGKGAFDDDILYSNLDVESVKKLRNYLTGWLERQGEA